MTELVGYNGKIAYVNLTENSFEIRDLDEKIAREYLGGVGLSAKLIYDMLSETDYKILKQNPLDPVNPLIFATGPVTGTIRPSSGRYSVCAVSPLTNIWGESTSGGTFCIALRNSGYDAIIFSGKSIRVASTHLNCAKSARFSGSLFLSSSAIEIASGLKSTPVACTPICAALQTTSPLPQPMSRISSPGRGFPSRNAYSMIRLSFDPLYSRNSSQPLSLFK